MLQLTLKSRENLITRCSSCKKEKNSVLHSAHFWGWTSLLAQFEAFCPDIYFISPVRNNSLYFLSCRVSKCFANEKWANESKEITLLSLNISSCLGSNPKPSWALLRGWIRAFPVLFLIASLIPSQLWSLGLDRSSSAERLWNGCFRHVSGPVSHRNSLKFWWSLEN